MQNSFKFMHPIMVTYQAKSLLEKMDLLRLIQQQQERIKKLQEEKEKQALEYKCQQQCLEKGDQEGSAESDLLGERSSGFCLSEENWWLLEVLDDIDVAIAYRQFEEAVDLILKAQKEIATSRLKTTKFFVDLSKGLEQRLHDFTDSLIKEMKNSLLTHANPGRFALLCIRLGKIKKSRAMYLKKKSIALRKELKNFKACGTIEEYIKKLSCSFFSTIYSFTSEFLTIFDTKACRSAFIIWLSSEMRHFALLFLRSALESGGLDSVAKCVYVVKENSKLLGKAGIDVYHIIGEHIQAGIINSLKQAASQVLMNTEGILFNASRTTTFHSHGLGFIGSADFLNESKSVQLHSATANFCRSADSFIRCSINLLEHSSSALLPPFFEILEEVFLTYARILQTFSIDLVEDKNYLVNEFVPHCSRLLKRYPQSKLSLRKLQKTLASILTD
ncbi:uncharacterized protein LOC135119519 [Zophobas morio]|uniref:uncharacterized protein LOC135119519 n=1 Tax=Zophobas morio TaxID=2755281 RepID=UPI003082B565